MSTNAPNRITLLDWDETGCALWMKRLEVCAVEILRVGDGESSSAKIRPSQLSLILDGIELSRVRRRKRYQLESPCSSS